jgi:hypothetical protein
MQNKIMCALRRHSYSRCLVRGGWRRYFNREILRHLCKECKVMQSLYSDLFTEVEVILFVKYTSPSDVERDVRTAHMLFYPEFDRLCYYCKECDFLLSLNE